MMSSQRQKVVPKKYQPYVAHWQQRKVERRSRLKQRHQAGLRQAKELADILKTEFGATKVVLFGSMLSVNDIHMHSDIDLAVWDLAPGKYIKALTALMNRSRDFSVDLVRIEEAPPSLETYIADEGLVLDKTLPRSGELSQDLSSMRNHTVLIARIKRELSSISAQYAETKEQLTVAKATGQNAYWMAVSLSLHAIYTGLEKIFEQIARSVDGNLDKGERWHKALLEQMATEITGVRTAVIDFQTLESLEEYLAFRHVVRSNYAYKLEPDRIEKNFRILENCYESVVKQLNDFCDFLASVD